MGQPMTPAGASKYFRWLIGVVAALALAAWAGALVTYLHRELISGPTRAVNGRVMEEEKGFLGIRNLLTVEYEAGGQTQRETIPVKGDGIGRGPRVAPYFYKPGASVELLVSRDRADAVRTDNRWAPAVQIWVAVGGGLLGLIALLVPVAIVTTQQHRRLGPAGR